jgi:hypothetical protein
MISENKPQRLVGPIVYREIGRDVQDYFVIVSLDDDGLHVEEIDATAGRNIRHETIKALAESGLDVIAFASEIGLLTIAATIWPNTVAGSVLAKVRERRR